MLRLNLQSGESASYRQKTQKQHRTSSLQAEPSFARNQISDVRFGSEFGRSDFGRGNLGSWESDNSNSLELGANGRKKLEIRQRGAS